MLVKRLAICLLAASSLAIAADWPQWRGVERDGVSKEAGLLQQWPEGGPPLAWKATGLGEGFASVAVAGGRIITQGQSRGGQSVVALDEATGRVLWQTPNGDAYLDRRGGGPRGTPTIDGETVYALGSNGSLIALEAATGKRLWATNLLRRFNARNINWGISESPLVDGRRVVVNAGGGGASIVAIDKSNGNVIWKSLDDEAGYSSAIVIEAGGVRQYVLLTGEAAVGVRADNGKPLWRYGRVSNRTANVATPIARNGRVFVSSDYGTGGGLLELAANGSGVDAKEIYFTREMRNHYNTPVLIGDHLYGYSSRILTCMNFETGRGGLERPRRRQGASDRGRRAAVSPERGWSRGACRGHAGRLPRTLPVLDSPRPVSHLGPPGDCERAALSSGAGHAVRLRYFVGIG